MFCYLCLMGKKKRKHKIDREKIKKKFGEKCAYCGEKLTDSWNIDHIIPKSNFKKIIDEGGQPAFLKHLKSGDVNHEDNLFPSCGSCNRYKDSYTLRQFRKELTQLTKRLNERTTIYRIAKRFNLIKENEIKILFYFETYKKK